MTSMNEASQRAELHRSAEHEAVQSVEQEQVKAPQSQAEADSLDSLLDDIESSLETNAEEYVRRFVQKGGE